jgi:hypothetical protein
MERDGAMRLQEIALCGSRRRQQDELKEASSLGRNVSLVVGAIGK